MKLLSIVKSPIAGKKWRAKFLDNERAFHTDFGAVGYQDYTQSKDPERARLYKLRHRKDLLTNNPTKAGYLSYYILWDGPNMEQNIRRYKNKFHM